MTLSQLRILFIISNLFNVLLLPSVFGAFDNFKDWSEYATAVGTLALGISAIWGQRILQWCSPPSARIELAPLTGDLGFLSDHNRAHFFHLKVVNLNKFVPLSNGCVQLVRAEKKMAAANEYVDLRIVVPRTFYWAPREQSKETEEVVVDRLIDLGMICNQQRLFMPMVRWQKRDTPEVCKANESIRYHLEIRASNFVSPCPEIFQIDYDGEWTQDPEEMFEKHVRITKLNSGGAMEGWNFS